MARKVFLSVLGTSFYSKCKYAKAETGFCSAETRFIQIASLEYNVAKEWNSSDIGYILITDQSEKDNWHRSESGKRLRNSFAKEEEAYEWLEDEIESMNLPFEVKPLKIKDGKNEEEIWDIFEKLYDVIEDEDELYIDITHGFRYIPMFMIVFCNYVKFLKKCTVKKISYGNFETMDKQTRIAPIIDITSFSTLQDWTAASDEFISTGSVAKLSKLYMPEIKYRLRLSLGEDEGAQALNNFIKKLTTLVNELTLCQGKRLIDADSISNSSYSLKEIETIDTLSPFKPLLEKIRTTLDRFDVNANTKNGIAAAKWCCDNGQYQQAITLLQETIVSMVCEMVGLDWSKEIKRKYVNIAFITLADKKIIDGETVVDTPDDKDLLIEERIALIEQIKTLPIVNDLKGYFSTLTAYRNKINHGTMLEGRQFKNVDNIATSIKDLTNKIFELTYTN